MPIDLTSDNFRETIEGNDIVFVDFWAPWCGPCRSFAPVYEKLAENNNDIAFTKVNTEDNQDLAGAFNIRSIPTLMAFREQIVVFNQAGALPEQAMEQVIGAIRALDMDKVREEIAAGQPG